MSGKQILNVDDIAEILGKTPAAVRMCIHRRQEGETIPPSFKLGAKRCWLRKDVYAWLNQKAKAYRSSPPRRRGRPRRQATGRLRDDLIGKKSANQREK